MPTTPLIMKANPLLNVNIGTGTVRSTMSSVSSGTYRPPVAPPSVPSEYLSRQELGNLELHFIFQYRI